MKCPKCGCENPDNSKYCMNCGSALTVDFITCPKCGKHLPKDSQFCDNCGTKIEKENELKKENKGFKNQNRNKYIIAAVIIVVIIGSIFYKLNATDNNKDVASTRPIENSVTVDDDSSREGDVESSAQKSSESAIKVVSSGYGFSREYSDEEADLYFGVEFKNTSNSQIIGWVNVKVSCRDKEGNVISSEEKISYACLEAGEIGGIAGMADSISQKPDKVDINFSFRIPTQYDYPSVDKIGNVTFSGAKVVNEDDSCNAMGDVINQSDKNLSYAYVYVIFKDKKGKIVGGDEIYVNNLQKGKNPFDEEVFLCDLATDNYVFYGVGLSS